MLKRLLISFYSLTFLFATSMVAQINENSPFPADVVVLSPSNITGIYDYGTQVGMGAEEWGPRLEEDVMGNVAWGYTAAGDTLGCEPIVTDLTGKMALIRRGACNFSLKVYHAQEAGAIGCLITNHHENAADDGNTLVGMLGGDSLEAVVIPAAFISRITGGLIASEIDAGNDVEVAFDTKTFYDPVTSYSYHTPVDQVVEVDVFQINLINPDTLNTVSAEVEALITDPSGGTTTLLQTADIDPATDAAVLFDETYTPDAGVGTYTVQFSNNINSEVADAAFVITEDTWAVDDNAFTGAVGPSDADFQDVYGLRYNTANLVFSGDNGAIAPYASFGIGNATTLNDTGDETTFAIRLYDADADGDDVLDLANGFDDLVSNVIAGVDYTMDGTEMDNELIYVEMESFTGNSVELEPNHPYFIAILYNGLDNGNGIAPRFTRTNSTPYLNFPTTPLELDILYTGWAGSTVVTRLHTENFTVDTEEELQLLSDEQVSLSPNPATDFVNLTLDLEAVADEVNVHILNVDGQLIRTEQFDGVRAGTFRIETGDLEAGTYFFSIRTPEGMRTKAVSVFN